MAIFNSRISYLFEAVISFLGASICDRAVETEGDFVFMENIEIIGALKVYSFQIQVELCGIRILSAGVTSWQC